MTKIAFISFIDTLLIALIGVGIVKLYENHKIKKANRHYEKEHQTKSQD